MIIRYDTVASNVGAEGVEPPKTWEQEDIQFWLDAHITDILSGKHINPTSDIFEQGFDRYAATSFTHLLPVCS